MKEQTRVGPQGLSFDLSCGTYTKTTTIIYRFREPLCTQMTTKCTWLETPWRMPSESLRKKLACVAGIRRGGKGERRASEAREDRTREDRARGIQLPSPSCPHFDFLPPFIRPDTQANLESLFMSIFQAWSNYVYMNRCYSSVRAEKSYIVFTTTIVSFNIAERCYVYRLFCEATIKWKVFSLVKLKRSLA